MSGIETNCVYLLVPESEAGSDVSGHHAPEVGVVVSPACLQLCDPTAEGIVVVLHRLSGDIKVVDM